MAFQNNGNTSVGLRPQDFGGENSNQRRAVSEKNHDMENNIGMSAKHGMQLPSRISNGGGAEEFQH